MKTYSFIGSDKNAGKTTALNFVYNKLAEKSSNIILSSIGINGEPSDSFIGKPKPSINVNKDHLFLTALDHLSRIQGLYEVIHVFTPPFFSKAFVLARALANAPVILEGPNTKSELLSVKQLLVERFKNYYFLIDGSIDRQFLADPEISDEFFFAILLADGNESRKKVSRLLHALSLPISYLKSDMPEGAKSIVLGKTGKTLYTSAQIAFLDEELLEFLRDQSNAGLSLFLNSALTQGLADSLRAFPKLRITLDNFTLFQCLNAWDLKLSLLNKPKVRVYFEKSDSHLDFHLPVRALNLYREDLHEARV